MIILSEANYRWLSQTLGYGASSSTGATSNLLTLFRNHLTKGGELKIRPESENITIKSADDFDNWVYGKFSSLAEMSDYPRENTFGTLPELALSNVIHDSEGLIDSVEPILFSEPRSAENFERSCPANAVLQVLSLLNLGENYEANYKLFDLENTGSLKTDIEHHFFKFGHGKGSDWIVTTEQHKESWEKLVTGSADTWFFNQPFSPKIGSQRSRAIIDAFIYHLRGEISPSASYKLYVTPPVFYEIFWEDIILEGSNHRWLLHFGFSD